MNQNELKQARLFSFKINNTIAVLLFYIILPLMLNLLPFLIYQVTYLFEYPLQIYLTNPMSLLYLSFYIMIPLLLIPLFIYILIICVINQKLLRKQEESTVRWFGFHLDNISQIILFILSIFNLLLDFRMLFGSVGSLITFLEFSSPPQIILIQFYASITVGIITICFYIYTVVICAKKLRSFR